MRQSVAAGMNPMDLKRGIDLAVEAVVADLVKKVTSNEDNRPGRRHVGQYRDRSLLSGAGKARENL
jgi:chaperonin GroEL (HSP60 family)